MHFNVSFKFIIIAVVDSFIGFVAALMVNNKRKKDKQRQDDANSDNNLLSPSKHRHAEALLHALQDLSLV